MVGAVGRRMLMLRGYVGSCKHDVKSCSDESIVLIPRPICKKSEPIGCRTAPAALFEVCQGMQIRTWVMLREEAYARVQALAEPNHVPAAWVMRTAITRFLDQHSGQSELPLRLPETGKVAA